MREITIALPDKLMEILEKIIAEDEISLFVNQAVLRQIEEFYAQLPSEQSPSSIDTQDDKNNHEWTI